MACTHHLNGGPLVCDNPREHPGDGRGCTYSSSTGSWHCTGDHDRDHG
jgi:hypothetical protein